MLLLVLILIAFFRKKGKWESVNVVNPVLLDDDEMEEEELPAAKKEKGKGRA